MNGILVFSALLMYIVYVSLGGDDGDDDNAIELFNNLQRFVSSIKIIIGRFLLHIQ